MTVLACLKWVLPPDGARYGGATLADQSALEWALRVGESWDLPVVAVMLGPPEGEQVLRDTLACGATSAHRIDADACLSSSAVGAALAAVALGVAARVVVCGDYSPDRGSGSTPAFIAGELGAQQALGLLDVEIADDHLLALRRLDGGRRERLRVSPQCVVSVEGGTATLRRAPLAAVLASRAAVVSVSAGPRSEPIDSTVRPYRPRARVEPAPTGARAIERIQSLLSSGVSGTAKAEPVTLDPPAAAERILAALTEWGYFS